ncbi:MAG: NUDIX domain-containing protein [Actinomycetota bacterium]
MAELDAEPELLAVVSPTGVPLGSGARTDVHRDGHWHAVFHCLVVRPGLPARVVLQRRHRAKPTFPGLLDLSATGHLRAGEQPRDGVRELREELGVDVDPDRLHDVGVRLLADDTPEGRNRERVHLFFLADDRPLEAFVPGEREVHSVVEAGVTDLLALAGGEPGPIPGIEFRPGDGSLPVEIRAGDLVDPIDGYWTVALVMAERFAAGHHPIGV